MKVYLECNMGASGDMFMSALYELLPDKDGFRAKMERLGLPGVTFEYADSVKCGIKGTHISVKVGGEEEKSEDVPAHGHGDGHSHIHPDGEEHHHRSGAIRIKNHNEHSHSARRYGYEDILGVIRGLDLPDNVLEDALGVYKIIGEAEAAVHDVPLESIHLHEVGALDAVADVVGCCLCVNMLGVTEITASPIHVGAGSVRCEHGILPVPAPATAEILKGAPIYGGSVTGELCTPTGAALLRHFVKSFGDMPPITAERIGCGMGTKDFEAANCLRAFLYDDNALGGGIRDIVYEISCNLDDMTPEAVGAVFDVLLENGALDVFAVPIMMKKNRPAVMLSCLCAGDMRESLARLMIEHTSTLGVRIAECGRYIMDRTVEVIPTKYGDIRVKNASGFGVLKKKPEYEDVLAASKLHNVPFSIVYEETMRQR